MYNFHPFFFINMVAIIENVMKMNEMERMNEMEKRIRKNKEEIKNLVQENWIIKNEMKNINGTINNEEMPEKGEERDSFTSNPWVTFTRVARWPCRPSANGDVLTRRPRAACLLLLRSYRSHGHFWALFWPIQPMLLVPSGAASVISPAGTLASSPFPGMQDTTFV